MDVGMILMQVYVFVLACFAGYQLISKVPPTLHTPLMSGSNAISGITILGAMLAAKVGTGSPFGVSTIIGTAGRGAGHDQRRRRLHGNQPHDGHVQKQRLTAAPPLQHKDTP